jgi:hypothetical protein
MDKTGTGNKISVFQNDPHTTYQSLHWKGPVFRAKESVNVKIKHKIHGDLQEIIHYKYVPL